MPIILGKKKICVINPEMSNFDYCIHFLNKIGNFLANLKTKLAKKEPCIHALINSLHTGKTPRSKFEQDFSFLTLDTYIL